MMGALTDWIILKENGAAYNLVLTLFLVLVLWLTHQWITVLLINRIPEMGKRYSWKLTLRYIAVGVSFLGVGRIWLEGLQAVATFLGLVSAGLAIALQDPIKNFAGWVYIFWSRPFRVGDRIQLGANAGDVIDQSVFQFTILEIGNWVLGDQCTGRIIHIPNGKIFSQNLINYFQGLEYIWAELQVLITFESDWRKAKTILRKIADDYAGQTAETARKKVRKAAREYMIYFNKLTPIVYTSVAESGVNLSIRFLSAPRRRRGDEEFIWEKILTEFSKQPHIEIAYPTRRFFGNQTEGKTASKHS